MKTVIEIQQFGDFNVMNTHSIMVHPEFFTVFDIKEEFCKFENIESFSGLPHNKLNEYTEKFVKFLKDKGFRQLETKSVYFVD